MSLTYQRRTNLPRLHYVTQGARIVQHLEQVEALCAAGCPWIQLRLKEVGPAEYEKAAQQALVICRAHGALLTINDNWKVALAVQADGIHVGKTDEAPAKVRAAYPNAIIGATANTWEDVQRLANTPIDYIGLGPLRFTSTKKKLSPILGVSGYQKILEGMKEKAIDIPILAIGGVLETDIALLRQIGVWGIAASGFLIQSNEKELLIKRILS